MLTILVSVWDKVGLAEFLTKLKDRVELRLIATSSTKAFLEERGFECISVEGMTGFPEILGGRVKTLHPKVFAGLLARDIPEDKQALKDHGIEMIDMAIVSLYPFEKKLQENLKESEMIEFIDIGGVSLIRAAAKNFNRVAIICDPSQYEGVAEDFEKNKGKLTVELRKRLAMQSFQHTANYDRQIGNYFATRVEQSVAVGAVALGSGAASKSGVSASAGTSSDSAPATEKPPATIKLHLDQYQELRYGENPHQAAVWYSNGRQLNESHENPMTTFPPFEQLQGKELSSNNITDTYCLVKFLRDIGTPGCCIIKHNNPCGVAVAKTIEEAFDKAYSTDPTSAFGGIYGFTEKVTAEMAKKINEGFIEIVLAPEFDADALEAFKKKKNVRVLKIKASLLKAPEDVSWHLRDLQDFGVILEKDIEPPVQLAQFQCVTGKLGHEHMADAAFAWSVVKHLTSNAIFLSKNQKSIGFGIGQTSRIASVKIALEQAGAEAKGAVMASDAFFPATDNIDAAKAAGIAVIVQPGGSIKDKDVIEACEKAGITMLFTGQRCFKH